LYLKIRVFRYMNVLEIGLEWFPERGGGLDRIYYDCMRYLPQAGVTTHGLVAGTDQVILTSHGQVRAFAAPTDPLRQRFFKLRQATGAFLAQQPTDIVAAHFALHTLPVLTQLGQRPLVFHFHGPWALEGQAEGNSRLQVRFKKTIEAITYRRATSFIVLSKAFQSILHRQYGVPLERIFIIPGGIAEEYFSIPASRYEARTQLDWPQDRPILFAVRRLVNRVGLEPLITAMQQVRRNHPEVLLLIAGKGALQQALQDQIDTLDLGSHVRLLGFVSDDHLKLGYRAADLSIVPSQALEGFGLIVIESLAAGTPVLGTPVGGIPEILQPLSPDLLFESSSSSAIAAGMAEALAGQRQLPSSDDCVAYAQQHYAWPVVAQQIKAVYEKTLSSSLA
jgi:glycosyltransferase involved in cell wall biosynthesis